MRTAGASTLRLLRSLREDGFEVWAPVKTERRRVSRMTAGAVIEVALAPSFVFVRAAHLVDMLELAAMPDKPRRGPGGRKPAHARFSVFHDHQGIPVIADDEMEGLRESERRRPKCPVTFRRKEEVILTSGAGTGLRGRVIRSNPKETLVDLGRFFGRVKISTFILQLTESQDAPSNAAQDAAAGGRCRRGGSVNPTRRGWPASNKSGHLTPCVGTAPAADSRELPEKKLGTRSI